MTATAKINYLNIALMLASAGVAMVLPFEVFLFAYAVLGPLHYLTEISWLHDRKYYTKGKYDVVVLLLVGLFLLAAQLNQRFDLSLEITDGASNRAIYIAFSSAIILIFVKKNWYKFAGIMLVCLTMYLADHAVLFLSVFLPTLIHVFVFTALFLLYGALKSRSSSGYFSFFVMMLCPFLLFILFSGKIFLPITQYGLAAYKNFEGLNFYTLQSFFHFNFTNEKELHQTIYSSTNGIVVMRFIAYAYTYHYLNWFSKTNIIRWHEIPKQRFTIVIFLWIISLVLYWKDYALGFQWLYFLSFLHVLLEFPLNILSIKGITSEATNILFSKKSTV